MNVDLSLVVPYHNEKYNLPVLFEKIVKSFEKIKKELNLENFEVIFIDDGSNDESTLFLVQTIENSGNFININLRMIVYRFFKNYGQSAALSLGFSKARGKYIATIDSDLQNDPEDLLTLLKVIIHSKDVEVVSGYRENRQEGLRVFISNIGNLIIRFLSGYYIKDVGCSLKIYKDYVVKDLVLPYGYHRFLPIITRANKNLIINHPVKHFKRIYGSTHYNYSRIFWLLKNLIVLFILGRYKLEGLKRNLKKIYFCLFLPTFILGIFSFLNLNFLIITFLMGMLSLVTYLEIEKIVNFEKLFKNYEYQLLYEREYRLIHEEISTS